jgi:hypothetical protein
MTRAPGSHAQRGDAAVESAASHRQQASTVLYALPEVAA